MNEYKEKRYNFPLIPSWVMILIVLIFALAFGVIKVDAAEGYIFAEAGTFTYNGVEYPYYYLDSYQVDMNGVVYNMVLDSPVYGFCCNNIYIFVSLYNDNHITWYNQSDGSLVTTTDFMYNSTYGFYTCSFSHGGNNISFPDSGTYVSGLDAAFYAYLVSDEFEKIVTMPDLSDIEFIGTYSEYIPTPKITVDNDGYGFGFNNATDDYYFELQGRWYSVDDIELFKENVVWQYKYSTIIKSNLSTWVSASDKVLAIDGYDFSELGSDFFNDFLDSYPVDDRTYYGGTNAIGNYFSGYSDAMDTLKMLLAVPESLYNGLEVYIRYFTIDNEGNVNYGKWCHWYDALADSSGSSGSEWDDKENMHNESQSESGLTTEQKESLESSGNSKSDTDVITNYINNSSDEIASQQIWNIMESMINAMGIFPSLVSTVFGWLPSWLINMIAVSLGCMIVLRFLGR